MSCIRFENGLKIYNEEQLKIGQGGNTPKCPIDCDCCFWSFNNTSAIRLCSPIRNRSNAGTFSLTGTNCWVLGPLPAPTLQPPSTTNRNCMPAKSSKNTQTRDCLRNRHRPEAILFRDCRRKSRLGRHSNTQTSSVSKISLSRRHPYTWSWSTVMKGKAIWLW